MTEYPYNVPPLRPVHGEVYESASQRGEKILAREYVGANQDYEKFRDDAMPPARNRQPVESEKAYMQRGFDPNPNQSSPGGYVLLGDEQGDKLGDGKEEILR